MRQSSTRLQLNYVLNSELLDDIVDALGITLGQQLVSDFNCIKELGVPFVSEGEAINEDSIKSRLEEYESAVVSLYLSLAEMSSIAFSK